MAEPAGARPAVAACTIVSKNYLAQARALAESLRITHPGLPFHVLLVDRIDGHFNPAAELFDLLELERLPIPDSQRWCFQYNVTELNTAAKPYYLAHLFAALGYRKLVYLDPDILVLGDLSPLFDLLDRHSIVLTPHMLGPVADGQKPSEQEILLTGTFNLGFLALARTPTTDRLLSWWQRRLVDGCRIDFERGTFTDQRWMELAPSLFGDTHILRDPAYNIAYWNLHERRPTWNGRAARMADGGPVRFVHFSGYNPERLDVLSKHQTRHRLADLGSLKDLFAHYGARLKAHGHAVCKTWPYAFANFDDGVPIPDLARRIYHDLGKESERFGDPFRTGPSSFRDWLTDAAGRRVPPLFSAIHTDRPDLRRTFPDPSGSDFVAFCDWAWKYGRTDYRLDDRLLAPYRAEAARVRALPKPRGWPPQRVDRPFGVNLAGFLQSEKGVGEGGRILKQVLETAGVPVSLTNVIDTGSANLTEAGRFDPVAPYAINLLAMNADFVPIFSKFRGAERFFAGHYNVASWNWELPRCPPEWADAFRYFDEIWAPSRYTLAAIASVSPVPVRWVPYAVTVPETLPPGVSRAMFRLPEDKFLFLFAFDFHSFLERKNPLGLIRAFRLAFEDRDDVLLVLKSMHAKDVPAELAAVQEAIGDARNIHLLDTVLPRSMTFALMGVCDCFVSLHRAEGFGLNIAEAMALGKPVIATGWSSNTDFMAPGNSLAVRYELVEIAADHGPYRKGQRWAEPEIEHAAALLRRVADDREFAARLGEQARRDIARELSPERVGARVRELLMALTQRPCRTDGLRAVLIEQSEGRLAGWWWSLSGGRLGPPPRVLRDLGRLVKPVVRLARRVVRAARGMKGPVRAARWVVRLLRTWQLKG